MPCDTIQRSSVSLELKAENKDLLKKALESLGFIVDEVRGVLRFRDRTAGINGDFANGKLNLYGERTTVQRFDVNAVKRAYSVQVVQFSAKKFGWKLTQPNQGELKFAVQKRGF